MNPATKSLTHPFLRGRLMALAAAFTLAACGGGDDDDPAPPPPPPPANTAPTAEFTGAATALSGEPVVFDASGSADADGDPLVYSWNFGNGLRGGGEQIAHIYDEPGTYTVELTVNDGRGGQAVVQGTVSVSAGATASGSVDTLAVVRSATGTPLSGVTVSAVGGASAATGADGRATVATLRGVPVTLKFSRNGYADQFKRVTLPTAAESGYVEVTMLPREAPLTLDDAADGGELTGKDGVRITLPAGSLVDADGNPVSGPVQVAMTPVDVTAEGRLFPGRYEGVGTDGTQGLIFSYGTVEFVLTQDGAPVQLAPGRKATIEIPVYATLDRDGREVQVGDPYPLWSLNERTGTWVVEGTGTVVAAGTPSGLALRGEVTHFSWWNHDVFDSARPYNPKPRCLVDTNYDGQPENLTGTGYCSHEASPFWEDQQTTARSVDRERAAAAGGERAANSTQALRFPAWVASTSTPVAGGVELPVPAGVNVVFQSYALNGTLYARTVVSGASDVSEDVDIVLQPVQDASGTAPISVPWNQVYAMSHVSEVDRFTITATAGQNFAITAGRSNFSVLNGSVVVRNPANAIVGSSTLGSGNASITVTNATAGTYTVEVTATSSAPGAYRLQALPVTASSSCASVTALSLPAPTTSYSIAGSSTRCFSLDLSAVQVIDVDLPSRGGLSGALQLRAPNDDVIARDTFQSGSRTPVLRLGVAQAGTYQLEIVNNSASSGTVQLRGSFITDAQLVSLPQEVTANDIGLGETRSYLLKQPVAGARFGTALTVCDGTYAMVVYPSRTSTQVSRTTTCGTNRTVGAQGHELHPLVLPLISVTRNANSTDSTGAAEFTLATLAPIALPLDTDVAVTPPALNRALVYVFDGSAGQEVGLGYDRSAGGSGVLTRFLNGPDGAALSPSGGVTTLPGAGLYTVAIANESSTLSGDFRIRLNNVPAPQPWPLTPPLTERTETLPLGQVLRYTFALNQAEVYTLRLGSATNFTVSASVGDVAQGSASVSLSGSSAPQQASTGASYARIDGTRTLRILSSSTTQGRSSGTFTVGIQKPAPTPTVLGAEGSGTLTPFLMQSYAYAVPSDGYYLLRWRYEPSSATPQFTVWAPSTTFANYTGEFGAILSSPFSEVVGSALVGERPGLLKAGTHTVTAFNSAASGNVDHALSLVRLDAPVDLTVGAAATASSIGVAGERDYYRFTGVAGQGYTLDLTAQFGGDVYVRRLPGSGNHTDRAATTLATFPRTLTAGVPLSATFTIPADQGGTYIVEIDGAQDATGSYTVQITSP